MRQTLLSILIVLGLNLPLNAGDDFCGLRNTTFQSGETLTFKVYYTLGIYVAAGEAKFTVNLERMNNKPVYHITGDGKTFSFYDSFFKVRDRYESYIDTATLQPLKFIRNVYEGGYKKYETVSFNQSTNTAVSGEGTINVPNCIQDVMSALYYARNIDFNKFKVDDKIPFAMYLGNEVYNLYIRYLGKETIKTKYGKFKAIKFKPLLIKGTIFEGGEKMTVWISDDRNHIPLRVESPISVGSIKVDMMDYRNLRHSLSSMIGLN
ncbi:MAG: DUF3108 domain-containing protein [Chitinophagaceae bacterium]